MCTLDDLIRRPPAPYLGTGVRRISYPFEQLDLRRAASEHLVAGGYAASPLPFETLHGRVPRDEQLAADGLPFGRASACGTAIGGGFMAEYHKLVRHLARHVLERDV